MRLTLTLTAALLTSTAALADDITLYAPITEATLYYGDGAEVTRRTEAVIPVGEHRIRFIMHDADTAFYPQLRGPEGLEFGPVTVQRGVTIAEGAYDTADQAAARAAIIAAEDALQAAQDEIAAADTALQALATQLAYLQALSRGGQDGVTMPEDPALVVQFLSTLGTETARVLEEQQAVQIARRDLAETVQDRQIDFATAQQVFAATQPFGTSVTVLEATVRAETETSADLTLSYATTGGWVPRYELYLDSETSALTMDRTLEVTGNSAIWQDVAMRFSTAAPGRERSPSQAYPSRVRIEDPVPPAPVAGLIQGFSGETNTSRTAPALEPVVVVEDTAAVVNFGLSLSYDYARPVTLRPGQDTALPLDTLAFDAETEARALPRVDQTAFLMAMTENESGEPILPGEVAFYRDGDLIGDDYLYDLIPEGGEMEFAFGSLDHLRLTWIDRSLAEGDRGLFTTSNTQERVIAFGVENLSGEAEAVRLIYATPFTEQEDLELDLTLSRAPDERDIDEQRGIHAWEIELAPGADEIIEMDVELSWPEGQILTWRP